MESLHYPETKMKHLVVLLAIVGCVFAAAPYCDETACKAPNCRCISTEIPGGLSRDQTPQIVLLTFDDAVTEINYAQYKQLLFNRMNPNNCSVTLTYFMSHEYADYSLVNDLYSRGYEIASHSITHRTNSTFWDNAGYTEWYKEFVGMREILEKYGNIPSSAVSGTRSPFLKLGGNEMFTVLKNNSFKWDCTWTTRNFVNPGLWPYTLDYRSWQDCLIGRCPDESFPGVWIVPMLDLTDVNGNPCGMLDTCAPPTSSDDVFNLLMDNFNVHYNGNRAPYGLYLHAAWFQTWSPYAFEGYERFLDEIGQKDDTYVVTMSQLIEWVKNPTPLSNIENFAPWKCSSRPAANCNAPLRCRYPDSPNGGERYMNSCTSCPPFYPWYDNTAGTRPPL